MPATPCANRAYIITDVDQKSAIDLDSWHTADGAHIISFERSAHYNQRWVLRPADQDCFGLINAYSDRCLEVDRRGGDRGAHAQQWFYWGGRNQQWSLVPAAGGFNLRNASSGLCLQRPDHAGRLSLAQPSQHSRQIWHFTAVPDPEQPLPPPSQSNARAIIESRTTNPVDHRPRDPVEVEQRVLDAVRNMRLSDQNISLFSYSRRYSMFKGDDIFIKAINQQDLRDQWSEPYWTQWAAKYKFSPAFVGYDSGRGVLVTELLKNSPSYALQRDVQAKVLRLARRIHQCAVPPGSPSAGPPMFVDVEAIVAKLPDSPRRGPLAPHALGGLVQHVKESMHGVNVPVVPRFGDLWCRNIIYDNLNDDVRFIDWEDAHLGDGMMDLARLAFESQIPLSHDESLIRQYYGRSVAEPLAEQMQADLKHLRRCITVVDLFRYAFYVLYGDRHRAHALEHCAQRIQDDADALHFGVLPQDEKQHVLQ